MAMYHPLFMNKVAVTETGCWKWLGNISPQGYGMTRVPGEKTTDGKSRRTTAHRWAYEQKHGKPADGLVLDHLCRNKWCCNPDHVEPVTQRENLYRSPLYMSRDCRPLSGAPKKPRRINGTSRKEVAARFKELRSDFAKASVNGPKVPFVALIRWKVPTVNEEQYKRLAVALAGKASRRDAELIPIAEQALAKLQAA